MARIQTIVNEEVKNNAEVKFLEYGLNLSQGVRFILTSFINGNFKLSFDSTSEFVKLSEKAKSRYKNIKKDILANQNITDLEDL